MDHKTGKKAGRKISKKTGKRAGKKRRTGSKEGAAKPRKSPVKGRATKVKETGTGKRPARTRSSAAPPLRYSQLDHWEAIERINDGLETTTLDDIRKSLDLTLSELSVLVQISPRTLSRRRSQDRLAPDESERAYRILRLIELATDVFGCKTDAREWMKEANVSLAERSPLELAKSEPGVAIVERLLQQIRYGIAV